MNHYVISDIHGCILEFKELIKQIFDEDKNAVLVCVGDLIDRGPASKEVIDLCIELKTKGPHQFLMGNHEQQFLKLLHYLSPHKFELPFWIEAYTSDKVQHRKALWYSQGGKEALASYNIFSDDPTKWIIPDEHLQFLLSMPAYYQTENFFASHALVSKEVFQKIENNTAAPYEYDSLLWNRDLGNLTPPDERVFLSGHTPFPEVQYNQEKRTIQIDTYCYNNGSLSAWSEKSKQIIQVKAKDWYFQEFD